MMGSDMRHGVLTRVARKTADAIVTTLKSNTMHEINQATSRAIRPVLPSHQDNHFRQPHRDPRLRNAQREVPHKDPLRYALPLLGA